MVNGDSKEAVAYALLMGIAKAQDKVTYVGNANSGQSVITADEEWMFKTFEKCLSIAGGASAAFVLKKG